MASNAWHCHGPWLAGVSGTWRRDLDLPLVQHLHLGQQGHESRRVVPPRDVPAHGEDLPLAALLQQGVEQTGASYGARGRKDYTQTPGRVSELWRVIDCPAGSRRPRPVLQK